MKIYEKILHLRKMIPDPWGGREGRSVRTVVPYFRWHNECPARCGDRVDPSAAATLEQGKDEMTIARNSKALCDRLDASLTATAVTRRRLLDSLVVEALAPVDVAEMEAAE